MGKFNLVQSSAVRYQDTVLNVAYQRSFNTLMSCSTDGTS